MAPEIDDILWVFFCVEKSLPSPPPPFLMDCFKLAAISQLCSYERKDRLRPDDLEANLTSTKC